MLGRAALIPALALWFGPDLLLAYHVFMPQSQGLVRAPRRFATHRREVWLTLDDGPDPEDTPKILELLAAHEARATFFVIGQHARTHPDLVRAIVARGHEVGHHSHSHPVRSFWCASPTRLRRELDDGLAALQPLGVRPRRFRVQAGVKNLWLASALASRGLAAVGWTRRGLEVWNHDPAHVADRVLQGLAPGNILLMHEGPSVPAAVRVRAVGLVLARLRREDYRCVIPTPGQLLGRAAPEGPALERNAEALTR